MKILTADLIATMLLQQDAEFQTGFESVNRPLYAAIKEAPQSELIAVGEQLIAADDASRRILGIRLIRELKQQFAERAARDLTDLLEREQDKDVIYWIVAAFGFLKSDLTTNQLISLADHSYPGIRFHTAGALSNCASSEISEQSVAALIMLSGDVDAEVRFSAIFELGAWWQVTMMRVLKRRSCRLLNLTTIQSSFAPHVTHSDRTASA